MNDDLTGQRLGASLREHTPTPSAPFDLADVKTRARGIRRRRTVAGATAGVAASVVAAMSFSPAVLTALQGEDDAPPPVASPAPSPTFRGDVRLDGDEPRGDDAESWSHTDALRDALGDRAPDDVRHVARVGSTWALSYSVQGDRFLRVLDSERPGQEPDEWKVTESVSLTEDGEGVAFVDRDTNEVTVAALQVGGASAPLAQLPAPGDVVGVSGDLRECLASEAACEVVVQYNDDRSPQVVDGTGRVETLDSVAVAVDDVRGDLVALRDRETISDEGDPQACSRVLDGGTEIWRSCELGVEAFSPDGSLTAVVDAYRSGWGPSRVGIADARTGKRYFWIDPPGEDGGIGDVAWEDAEHLVVSTWSWTDQTWRLYRVSVTGEAELAASPIEGTEDDFPFVAPLD